MNYKFSALFALGIRMNNCRFYAGEVPIFSVLFALERCKPIKVFSTKPYGGQRDTELQISYFIEVLVKHLISGNVLNGRYMAGTKLFAGLVFSENIAGC